MTAWIGNVMGYLPPKPSKEDDKKVVGTHLGHLDQEGRERRRAKNKRNQARRGQATRPLGSPKRIRLRRAGTGRKSSGR